MWQRFNSRFIGAWQPGKSQRYVWQRKISTLYSRLQLPRLRQHSPVRSRGRRFGATPSASSKSQVRPPWHRWEEHWSPVKVEEGLRSGEVLIGRLHVPSFQTDTAFVVTKLNEEDVWIPVTGFAGRNRALHGDEVAALPLWSPWRPGGATKDPPLEAPPPPPPAQELDLTALTVAQFRDAVLSHLRASEEQALPLTMLGNLEEVQNLRKGLGGLRKALQRLEEIELIEEGQPPEWIARLKVVPAPPSSSPPTVAPAPRDGGREGEQNLSRARCRVVAVMKRSPQNVGEIVAMARDIEGGAPLKAQPRDRRLPALWLLHPEISQGVASVQSELMKRDERREAAREAATVARQQSLSHEALSKALQESQKGVLCVVKFRDWPDESLSPRADLVEILGPSGTAEAEADALLAFFALEWRRFPEAVEQQLREQFPDAAAVVESELPHRRDLRHLKCVTIDPPHAKDLDDAVSVGPGKAPGSYRVGVHIADVTHFLRPGTATDLEARKRATTVYLVSRTYPMLPRWLSENLCSLLPDGDRLAFSVFFTIHSDGRLDDTDPPEMCRTVIRTHAKLSYDMVDNFLTSNESNDSQIPSDLHQDLRSLAEITAARRRRRTEQGALVLERSSAAFQLDDNGRVLGVVRESSSSVSHQLIEELMVLANHVVAESLLKAGISDGQGEVASEAAVQRPLLRCHPDTEEEVKKALVEILPQELQHRASVDQPLQALLLWCSQELPPIKYEAVCDTVLKSFKEANYMVAEGTEEDVEHWALSLPSYMHFTSPIRRYADVLVHRRLAHILDIDTNTEKPMVQSHQAFLDTPKNAVDVCNTKKRDAQDAQMEEIQIVLSDYVHRSGGIEVDDAVITRILVPQSRESRETSEKEGQQLSFRERVSKRTFKEALEIYVPLAQTSRSLSLEVLNLEPLEFPAPPATEKVTSGEASKKREKSREVQSLRVRVASTGEEMTLQKLQRLHVCLTAQDSSSESRHWTIRLPWAEVVPQADSDPIPPPAPPMPPLPPLPPPPPARATT